MKIPLRIALILLFALILNPAPLSACETDVTEWSREQFMEAFDVVARNFGAVEYATFTYMIEFGEAPESLDVLRDSGHLNVFMDNPYTDGGVISLIPEDFPDGDLAGNILVSNNRNNGRESHLEAWFLRIDDETIMQRSMVKRIALFESEVEYALFFENELPRDEQLVTIYCTQAIDAIESFQQRNPEAPENFIDMWDNGDVNVHYINPITSELAVSNEELSPGNFFYEKLGPEEFTLIGWGRERPVFFATTSDEVEEEFYATWVHLFEDDVDEE